MTYAKEKMEDEIKGLETELQNQYHHIHVITEECNYLLKKYGGSSGFLRIKHKAIAQELHSIVEIQAEIDARYKIMNHV